jgi:hypothetical protein
MRKIYKILIIFAIAIATAQDCHAYTGLVGAEFVVYPPNGWSRDMSYYGSAMTFVSAIPMYDNTQVAICIIADDGSEDNCIFNGTLNKGQARDFTRTEIGAHWLHIFSNESMYIYAGAYGALRSPPAINGRFYYP